MRPLARTAGLLLLPAVPESAGKLLTHLGVPQDQWKLEGLQDASGAHPQAPFRRPAGTPIGGGGAGKLVMFPKPTKK